MIETGLMYLLLISQGLFISGYMGNRIYQRMRYVLTHYPKSRYPKLYPLGESRYQHFVARFRMMHLGTLALSMLTLVGLYAADWVMLQHNTNFIAAGLFVLQSAPMIMLEVSQLNQGKLMREHMVSRVRVAEIAPRSISHYVTPGLLWGSISCGVGAVLFAWLSAPWQKAAEMTGILAIGFTIFGVIIYWNLFGKKPDPHQAEADRFRQVSLTIGSLLKIAILASLFLVATLALDTFLSDKWLPLLMSVYFHLIAWVSFGTTLNDMQIGNIDFSVYQSEPQA